MNTTLSVLKELHYLPKTICISFLTLKYTKLSKHQKSTKNECIQIERSIVFYHQSVINASVTNIVDMADMLQK